MASPQAVVVGGGIGGLAAATGLRRAGFDVTVVERASSFQEVGAGIGLAPNATAALERLGAARFLRDTAVRPVAATRRSWRTGEELVRTDLDGVAERFGTPFWFAHRGDLQTALLKAATDPEGPGQPVRLLTDVACRGVDVSNSTVELADGRTMSADLIVGADGIRSMVRRSLFGADSVRFSHNAAFRTQVPVAGEGRSAALTELIERRSFESWLGPDGHVVHAPFRSGTEVNVTICLEVDEPVEVGTVAPADRGEVLARLDGWNPALRELVESGGPVFRYDIYDIEPLDSWVQGRVVLLGDAAHPMLPYLGQGAAQAIEDGEYLGRCLGEAGVDIAEGLERYERARRPRATAVQTLSRENRHLFHVPDGPAQVARDARLRQGASDGDVFAWLYRLDALPPREHAS